MMNYGRVKYGAPTPWARSQSRKAYRCGVSFHETAGHGGFFVPKRLAEKHIPEAVRAKAAIRWRSGDWYEEDIAQSVVWLTIPGLLDEMSASRILDGRGEPNTVEELRAAALGTLWTWTPDVAAILTALVGRGGAL